jgi:hypothetical protein
METFASFLRDNQTSDKVSVGSPIRVTDTCSQQGNVLTGPPSTRDYSSQITEKYEQTNFVGYFNGELRSVRLIDNRVRQGTLFREYFVLYGECGAGYWGFGFDKGRTSDTMRWDRTAQFSDNTVAITVWGYTPRQATTLPSNYYFEFENESWDIGYQGKSSPKITRVPIPLPDSNTITFSPFLVTNRSNDAIYTSTTLSGWPSGYAPVKFRNEVLTNKSIVVDASPLGEVFLATSDLSVVLHEPKRGPKVVIPPTLTQLLAAIWM